MQLKLDALEAHLAKGLKALYVVYGDEHLLAQEACDRIRAAARGRLHRSHGVHGRARLRLERAHRRDAVDVALRRPSTYRTAHSRRQAGQGRRRSAERSPPPTTPTSSRSSRCRASIPLRRNPRGSRRSSARASRSRSIRSSARSCPCGSASGSGCKASASHRARKAARAPFHRGARRGQSARRASGNPEAWAAVSAGRAQFRGDSRRGAERRAL